MAKIRASSPILYVERCGGLQGLPLSGLAAFGVRRTSSYQAGATGLDVIKR